MSERDIDGLRWMNQAMKINSLCYLVEMIERWRD